MYIWKEKSMLVEEGQVQIIGFWLRYFTSSVEAPVSSPLSELSYMNKDEAAETQRLSEARGQREAGTMGHTVVLLPSDDVSTGSVQSMNK